MVLMIAGDGTFRHFPEKGSLREQPARDMEIYDAARGRWVERMNEKIRSGK
jgi:hypothetical protein